MDEEKEHNLVVIIIGTVPRETPRGCFFLASLVKLKLCEKNPTLQILFCITDYLNSGKTPGGVFFSFRASLI